MRINVMRIHNTFFEPFGSGPFLYDPDRQIIFIQIRMKTIGTRYGTELAWNASENGLPDEAGSAGVCGAQ